MISNDPVYMESLISCFKPGVSTRYSANGRIPNLQRSVGKCQALWEMEVPGTV